MAGARFPSRIHGGGNPFPRNLKFEQFDVHAECRSAFIERRRTVPPIGGMLNQSLARRILMEIRQFLFVQGARADLAGVESVARQAQFVARTPTFSRPYGTQCSESIVYDPGTEVPGYSHPPRRGSVHKAIEPTTFSADLSQRR